MTSLPSDRNMTDLPSINEQKDMTVQREVTLPIITIKYTLKLYVNVFLFCFSCMGFILSRL